MILSEDNQRWISVKGKIYFQPENKTRKHIEQSSWKRIAMIVVNDDLTKYYSWFIEKRFNLKLNPPLRGTHVTFINDHSDKVPHFEEVSKIFHRKEIEFWIDPSVRTNGKHWWLPVRCKDAESIRIACGGSPQPEHKFHLTIGLATGRYLEHSKLIHKAILFHGI